jgi:hypothetical protein
MVDRGKLIGVRGSSAMRVGMTGFLSVHGLDGGKAAIQPTNIEKPDKLPHLQFQYIIY